MSEVSKEIFIENYSKAIHRGDAAAFVGAGMSVPSGFIDWKNLLRPFSDEIGLSIEREVDYLAVAQYFYNRKRNRIQITQAIRTNFGCALSENESAIKFAKLNIGTVWTTNYDHVLEEAYLECGKKPDVKTNNLDMSLYDEDAAVTLYKMHGDITYPSDTVFMKDEYETYFNKRKGFVTTLKGHLLSKTFLFVGYSFSDPNISYILAWVRQFSEGNTRTHYWIVKRVNKDEEDYEYKKAKQDLVIDDFLRYGIEVVLIDGFDEIPELFDFLRDECNKKNVFISSSLFETPTGWNINEINEYMKSMSEKLIDQKYVVTSGYGLGVGSSVITGALTATRNNMRLHFDKYLHLYPFPQGSSDPKRDWKEYRHLMMENCRIAIFAFGNKAGSDGKCIPANGVISEFEIAKEKNMLLIPLAATGGASRFIYDKMKSEAEEYPYLSPYWDELLNKIEIERLLEIVNAIKGGTYIHE